MKLFYKGFDLTVRTCRSATEQKLVRMSKAMRRDDQWELAFYPSKGNALAEIANLKKDVDRFYKRPDCYDAPTGNKKYEPAPARKTRKATDEEE